MAEGETPHGLTVNSFTSVSADPPLILVCIDLRCSLLPFFEAAEHFAVNILAEEQRDLSSRFAEVPEARFDGVLWRKGINDAPILAGVLSSFECRREQVLEAGDHKVLIGRVTALESGSGRPLLYFDSRYDQLGRS